MTVSSSTLDFSRINRTNYQCIADQGRDQVLDCERSVFPQGTLEATFSGTALPVANIRIEGTPDIMIDNFTMYNFGTLQCTATNRVAGSEMSTAVIIKLIRKQWLARTCGVCYV